MNKSELIRAAADKTGLTMKDTEATLNALTEAIQAAVAAGDKVQLVGFGTFEPRERNGREGISPATREKIMIPAKRVPAFKAGKVFKDAVDVKPAAKGKKK